MPKFIKRLISGHPSEAHKSPQGKQGVTSHVEIPGGKGFWVVREDIFQQGLAKRSKEAA